MSIKHLKKIVCSEGFNPYSNNYEKSGLKPLLQTSKIFLGRSQMYYLESKTKINIKNC